MPIERTVRYPSCGTVIAQLQLGTSLIEFSDAGVLHQLLAGRLQLNCLTARLTIEHPRKMRKHLEPFSLNSFQQLKLLKFAAK